MIDGYVSNHAFAAVGDDVFVNVLGDVHQFVNIPLNDGCCRGDLIR